MGDNLVYAVRSSEGFYLKRGLGKDAVTVFEQNKTSRDVACNVFAYSNNGQLFAYCDNQVTRVFEIATNKEILCVELKRTRKILFSPKDNFLLTFEPWAVYGPKRTKSQNQMCESTVLRMESTYQRSQLQKKHRGSLSFRMMSRWLQEWLAVKSSFIQTCLSTVTTTSLSRRVRPTSH
ncbi:Eukaryotic translation initiation factor 2A [Caenorhabditis elegans]|uniref:Isoform b of Eukaryotic translation initiation factor 2A n=1 Tax=Caenorhabditis elegans TaxID=6239 RepID=Q19052-2|nr:Eukaryotic translation initiation factor 2A [Caenorhabditis elegans]CAC42280.2 Eukaryotic translation initiation factor 2A [Caenorhabditis elegans]|eukprot:NP_496240.2 Eukaryotic translation initiation factor 2A [Caenorhabditis elegans]